MTFGSRTWLRALRWPDFNLVEWRSACPCPGYIYEIGYRDAELICEDGQDFQARISSPRFQVLVVAGRYSGDRPL